MNEVINVKALRESLGLSQAAFGERVGVDQSTVSHWENGKKPRGPALKLLQAMAGDDLLLVPQDADRVSTAGAAGDLVAAPAFSGEAA